MEEIFLFDFDGVLLDTVDEVAVTAYNLARGEMISSLEQTPEGYGELFRRNRCRIQHAGEIPGLGAWCAEHCISEPDRMLSQAEAEELFHLPTAESVQMGEKFFETRTVLMSSDREAWLRLNYPFQPLWNTLCGIEDELMLVLTYKNRAAVLELFSANGRVTPPENVYAGDGGARKEENLLRICERFRCTTIHYIDDNLKNLRQLSEGAPKHVKFHPLFATWGYVTPEDVRQAKSEGFLAFSQEDFLNYYQEKRGFSLGK